MAATAKRVEKTNIDRCAISASCFVSPSPPYSGEKIGPMGPWDLWSRLCVAVPSKKCFEAEQEDDSNRAHGLVGIDLGFAGAAILENDGRLANTAACLTAAIEHFLLKRITSGDHVFQFGLAEPGHAVAAVSSARVVGGNAKEQARRC